jgi:hypothetical protein
MLYLQSAESNGHARAAVVPLAELTAAGFERALLAGDKSARVRELRAALVRDPTVASWMMDLAESRFDKLPPTFDDAVNWLAGCLEAELSARLTLVEEHNDRRPQCHEIESRLPALARRLAQYERQLADVDARLAREKLESLKELAYGASHEINNPLANIAARAQSLLDDETDPDRRRKLTAIHRQAMRAHEMIADLMLFARPPQLNFVACDAQQIAQLVVEELRELADEQSTLLTFDPLDEPVELRADATQIAVALQAVVINALEAVGEGGSVSVRVRKRLRAGAPYAEIVVGDDGPGISDEVRRHMFDPFFSGREAGRGLGFGLSKCWRLITDHGGQVVVRRPAAGGTEIAILLPLSTSAAPGKPVD